MVGLLRQRARTRDGSDVPISLHYLCLVGNRNLVPKYFGTRWNPDRARPLCFLYLYEQMFYSKTERGINETQVRVLALLLVRYIDAGPILKWAYNVLDLKSCIDDAVARESLNVLHKPCKDIGARSKEFETFVRGTTIGEREAAARALCLFDGGV